MLVPANMPPDGEYRLIPSGNAIQVTGEDKHLDALAPLLRPEGECWAYVTLHEVVEQLARGSRTVVEVRINGNPVGRLTPKMSGELLPTIRHVEEQGATAAARAIVKGNRIKAEVVLYVVRAHELPETWLSASARGGPASVATMSGVELRVPEAASAAAPAQVHAPIPPRPTGIKFVVPPGWPAPPPGWSPPPGWQPDPSWPAAPDGWQWWVPVWE
jgi:collagen type III alpha